MSMVGMGWGLDWTILDIFLTLMILFFRALCMGGCEQPGLLGWRILVRLCRRKGAQWFDSDSLRVSLFHGLLTAAVRTHVRRAANH